MIKYLSYILVIIFSNTIGAISGMGGGVIIKPALQLFNYDPVLLINFYSSIAVFTMAISSTIKQVKAKHKVDLKTAVWLSLGSVLGGIAGDQNFNLFNHYVGNNISVIVQMILVIASLIVSLWLSSGRVESLNITSQGWMFIVGLFLGWLSTVLGIGGGPINIACFLFIFGFGIRKATIYSIITIFFSQAAKISQVLITGSIPNVDGKLVVFILLSAIIGGWLGAYLSNIVPEKKILTVYNAVVIFVLVLDLINLVTYIII